METTGLVLVKLDSRAVLKKDPINCFDNDSSIIITIPKSGSSLPANYLAGFSKCMLRALIAKLLGLRGLRGI